MKLSRASANPSPLPARLRSQSHYSIHKVPMSLKEIEQRGIVAVALLERIEADGVRDCLWKNTPIRAPLL
jgi:hypothetical protein